MKYIEVDSLDVASVNNLIYPAVETVCEKLDSGYYGSLEPNVKHGIQVRGDIKLINQGGRRINAGAGQQESILEALMPKIDERAGEEQASDQVINGQNRRITLVKQQQKDKERKDKDSCRCL